MVNKLLDVVDGPVVASVIPTIFVTNLEDALEWYCRCLKFRVLAFNPHFATLEMSPGRICWIYRVTQHSFRMTNSKGPCFIHFLHPYEKATAIMKYMTPYAIANERLPFSK